MGITPVGFVFLLALLGWFVSGTVAFVLTNRSNFKAAGIALDVMWFFTVGIWVTTIWSWIEYVRS